MIIDNLPVLPSYVTPDMEVPIEDGTLTYKTTVNKLLAPSALLEVNCGTITALPQTVTVSGTLGITSSMIVVAAQFGTPSAVTWPWHFETTDGAITISVESDAPPDNTGINGNTTLTLYLEKTR